MKKWIAATGALVLCLAAVLFLNIGDVQTKQSASFDLDRFLTFSEGDAIADAIQVLGEPIRVSETTACEGCRIYLFQGDYPRWVMGGSESWYIGDAEGVIVSRVHLVEP